MNPKERFIEKANAKHNNYFDYSQFEYVNAKTKSIIICPQHGEFTQNPDKHLNSTYPCPECLAIHRKESAVNRRPVCKREAITKEEYLHRFFARHRDSIYVLDLSNYRTSTDGEVVLTCPEHGQSTYNPRSLLISKYACKECANKGKAEAKTKGFDEFIADANEVHNNKYTYRPESTYKNRRSKIIVTCPEHGEFVKTAQKHLSGQGCFECKVEELVREGILCGGYNDTLFERNPDMRDIKAYIYYLKVGNYFKIGITRNPDSRMRGIKSKSGMDVEVIQLVETTLEKAYHAEQKILRDYDELRIARFFSTELFSEDVLNGFSLLEVC